MSKQSASYAKSEAMQGVGKLVHHFRHIEAHGWRYALRKMLQHSNMRPATRNKATSSGRVRCTPHASFTCSRNVVFPEKEELHHEMEFRGDVALCMFGGGRRRSSIDLHRPARLRALHIEVPARKKKLQSFRRQSRDLPALAAETLMGSGGRTRTCDQRR